MNLSQVKDYLFRQWTKILTGRAPLQDFIIAKGVKLGNYKSNHQLPPGAHISVKKMASDPNAKAEYGDRIPYIVAYSKPKGRLIDSVVSPEEMVNDRSLILHTEYYITKQIIPPLVRVFGLVGADIEKWYNELPKSSRAIQFSASQDKSPISKKTIDYYYKSSRCIVCDTASGDGKSCFNLVVCEICSADIPKSLATLSFRMGHFQKRFKTIQELCRSCSSHSSLIDSEVPCISLDCPIYFAKSQVKSNFRQTSKLTETMDLLNSQLIAASPRYTI
jgi:DNA polymerase zeta